MLSMSVGSSSQRGSSFVKSGQASSACGTSMAMASEAPCHGAAQPNLRSCVVPTLSSKDVAGACCSARSFCTANCCHRSDSSVIAFAAGGAATGMVEVAASAVGDELAAVSVATSAAVPSAPCTWTRILTASGCA
eukprot:23840-Chlamydomonas_euryale.AAC.2